MLAELRGMVAEWSETHPSEIAWEVLDPSEDSGLPPAAVGGVIGRIGGAYSAACFDETIVKNPELLELCMIRLTKTVKGELKRAL